MISLLTRSYCREKREKETFEVEKPQNTKTHYKQIGEKEQSDIRILKKHSKRKHLLIAKKHWPSPQHTKSTVHLQIHPVEKKIVKK